MGMIKLYSTRYRTLQLENEGFMRITNDEQMKKFARKIERRNQLSKHTNTIQG